MRLPTVTSSRPSRRRDPRRRAVVSAFVASAVLLAPACSDDDPAATADGRSSEADTGAADGSNGATSSTTIAPGQDSPLDAAGGHDASVVVTYRIEGDGSGDDPNRDAVADLEERLMDALEPVGLGELDGSTVEDGRLVVTLYGPDLDALWERARPLLERYPARPAHAELRDGGPEQPATRVDMAEPAR